MCNAPLKNLASFGDPYSNNIIESSIGMRPSSVPYPLFVSDGDFDKYEEGEGGLGLVSHIDEQ